MPFARSASCFADAVRVLVADDSTATPTGLCGSAGVPWPACVHAAIAGMHRNGVTGLSMAWLSLFRLTAGSHARPNEGGETRYVVLDTASTLCPSRQLALSFVFRVPRRTQCVPGFDPRAFSEPSSAARRPEYRRAVGDLVTVWQEIIVPAFPNCGGDWVNGP